MEILLSISVVVLLGGLIFIEIERRKTVQEKDAAELRQYILEAQVSRMEAEADSLKGSLEHAHDRLNELARERDALGLGLPTKEGNGK